MFLLRLDHPHQGHALPAVYEPALTRRAGTGDEIKKRRRTTATLSSSFSFPNPSASGVLHRRAHQAAEDALDGDLRGVQAYGRVLRVGGSELDLGAEAGEP